MRRLSPLPYREFIRKLKSFGVIELPPKRGKGSERILVRPNKPGDKQGPQYPIKSHSQNDEVTVPIIQAALRRFGIDRAAFLKE